MMAYERVPDWTTAALVEALEEERKSSDRRHARPFTTSTRSLTPPLDLLSRTTPNDYPFNYVLAPRPRHLNADTASSSTPQRSGGYRSGGSHSQSSRSTYPRKSSSAFPSSEKKVRYSEEGIETEILAPSPIHLIFNGHDPQNVTVHLDLPVTDNIGSELEEFSILRRLGNFKAAKAYFKERLGSRRREPYVFVQYAQMLLDAGDYKALGRLRPDAVFGADHLQGSTWRKSHKPLDLIYRQWRLIRCLGLIHGENKLDEVRHEVEDICLNWEVPAEIDATEIQVIALTLRIWSMIYDIYDEDLASRRIMTWIDLESLYEQLLAQDRIWDFRDIIVSQAPLFRILPVRIAQRAREVTNLWQPGLADESTTLALLEVYLVYTSEYVLGEKESISWLGLASVCAENIRLNHPQAMRSRPYLMWILFKSLEEGINGLHGLADLSTVFSRNCAAFPGAPRQSGGNIFYYIPRYSENPGWNFPEAPPESNMPTYTILVASEQLGDLQTQAKAYRLLALRSAEPLEYLQKLSTLQQDQQGYAHGRLKTLLMSYLACKDKTSKQWLLTQLESTDDFIGEGQSYDAGLYFARDCIQRATEISLGRYDDMTNLRTPKWKYYEYLEDLDQEFLDKNSGLGRPGPPSRHETDRYSHGRARDASVYNRPSEAPRSILKQNIPPPPPRRSALMSEAEKAPESSPRHKSHVVRGPTIERTVITHYRDIDHGVTKNHPPSIIPPQREVHNSQNQESEVGDRARQACATRTSVPKKVNKPEQLNDPAEVSQKASTRAHKVKPAVQGHCMETCGSSDYYISDDDVVSDDNVLRDNESDGKSNDDDESDGGCPVDDTPQWPENTCRELMLWHPPERAGQQHHRNAYNDIPRDTESHKASRRTKDGRRFPSNERSREAPASDYEHAQPFSRRARDMSQRAINHSSQDTQAPDDAHHDSDDQLYSDEEDVSPRVEHKRKATSTRPKSRGRGAHRKGSRPDNVVSSARFSGMGKAKRGKAPKEARSGGDMPSSDAETDIMGRDELSISPGISRQPTVTDADLGEE